MNVVGQRPAERMGRNKEQEEGSGREITRSRELSQELVEQQMEQQRQRAELGGAACSEAWQPSPVGFCRKQMLTGSTRGLVDSRPSTASAAGSLSPKRQARSRETGEGQPGPVGLHFFSVPD